MPPLHSRVLLVFEPPDGGVAEHVLQLSLGLGRHGWEPTVAGPVVSSVRPRLESAGITYVPIGRLRRGFGNPLSDVAAQRQVRDLLDGFDVVHCHSSKAGLLVRLSARRSHAPVVYSPHCFGFVGDVSRSRKAVVAAAERRLAASTAEIICVCEAERQEALARGVGESAQLRRVYNGVPSPVSDPDQRLVELRGDGVLFGAITVLRPQKRVDVLLDAIPRVLDAVPAARAAVVGNGPLEPELREHMCRLRLDTNDRFAFLPFEPPSARYLQALDVFVLSSAWEAMPLGILEALGAGVPQVATDVGGTREAVDATTGELVPPGDPDALARALIALLSDDTRRNAAATVSRQRHRELFQVDRMVTETVQVYSGVVRHRDPLRREGV
jgi:glycosyltransferase involved in cell wall biosynthesis